jgi:hypothetical protein
MHILSLAKLRTINAPWYLRVAARWFGEIKRIPIENGEYAVVRVLAFETYYFDEVATYDASDGWVVSVVSGGNADDTLS